MVLQAIPNNPLNTTSPRPKPSDPRYPETPLRSQFQHWSLPPALHSALYWFPSGLHVSSLLVKTTRPSINACEIELDIPRQHWKKAHSYYSTPLSNSASYLASHARWCSGKESACPCRRHKDTGSIPGLGRSLAGGNGNPLQYSCLEKSMDRGAWWATVQRVTYSPRVRQDWARMHTCKRELTS